MRIIGLDYGTKTVGVAISDALGITAQGLETITRKEANKLRKTLARIEAIIEEYEVEQIVLGFPKNMDNSVGERAQDCQNFAEMLERRITGLNIIKALSKNGMEDIANNLLNMLKQRVTGDYLQTSAILDKDFNVISAVNDVNDYMGPGTGYRLDGQRWEEIKKVPTVMRPEDIE